MKAMCNSVYGRSPAAVNATITETTVWRSYYSASGWDSTQWDDHISLVQSTFLNYVTFC